ncbi:MAG: helix-turn-helix domain-containing protein [Deltaproteobacteria bacterium]|nr:helix-turn-helix domain-containing protein [Deltaproteobacteria bacterium]
MQFVNEREAAQRLGLSPKTLQRWRWTGRRLHFYKFGAAVRYSCDDLERFIAAGRRASSPSILPR